MKFSISQVSRHQPFGPHGAPVVHRPPVGNRCSRHFLETACSQEKVFRIHHALVTYAVYGRSTQFLNAIQQNL